MTTAPYRAVDDSLAEELRPLFWDHDFNTLSLTEHESLVVSRILSVGTWDAVMWLRRCRGDEFLRTWILDRQGRPLDAKQLRFWELILDLPTDLVDAWLDQPERKLWIDRNLSRQ